ncbi:hypothetical protein [Turneriella parva]|uniref:Uncharacterized protein n=1 Tax=Turneriella parva (strain ATCC BAA-1111 / DSM 21527 / NCTC 11395 / H) TaxID=869212 RepID=I4B4K9_TURPD|nr:hypothetical protein [Turneriella parva]AFM12216.1 hypothetical protein Turpa_1568 [Turneriella parva DSM 21527]
MQLRPGWFVSDLTPAPLGATFSYRLTPDVSVVAGAIAKGRFFQNSQGFSTYFLLGAGYDF